MIVSRVGYVVNSFPKLSETFIAREIIELRRRGVEILILSLRVPTEKLQHRMISEAGLSDSTVYDPLRFRPALLEFQPQLLHAHFATKPTAVARELAAELKVPFTFTAHRYDIYSKAPEDFADRAAAAGALITVSEANVRYIVETFGVAEDHITVIPCGVDTERFRPKSSYDELVGGRSSELPWIVCVARLVPFKNQRLLLEACARLVTRGRQFRCAVIGDGPSRDELEVLRTQLGLEDVVTLFGAAEEEEVLAWWQRAAIAVLTSESEGMPVSLMEALACGVPVVSTAVGGIPEMIENRVSGLLVPPGDIPSLVASLEELLQNQELAARLGSIGRQRAKERFSIGHQVDCLLDLWAGVLEAKEDGHESSS